MVTKYHLFGPTIVSKSVYFFLFTGLLKSIGSKIKFVFRGHTLVSEKESIRDMENGMSRLLEVFPDIDPGFLQAKAEEFDGNYGSISCGVSGGYKIRYRTRAIITWGLYIFLPHFSLYSGL